jgi:pyruvate kinase
MKPSKEVLVNSPDSPSNTLNKRQLSALLGKLRQIRSEAKKTQHECIKTWKPHIHWHGFQASAGNMGAYIGLRRHDLRDIQSQLAALGLSSLGRSEGHVLASLDAVIHTLEALAGKSVEPKKILAGAQKFNEAAQLLDRQTGRLFGPPPSHRNVRIMVTFPSEAASDYAFVRELVRRGMDCARINCAHDTPEAWHQMITFVRQAETETDRSCKILMDLAGPKLRTGTVIADQSVVHLKPRRSSRGTLKEPAAVILDGSGVLGRNAVRDAFGHKHRPRLSVNPEWLKHLIKGDSIEFTDLRGKACEMVVDEQLSQLEVVALTNQSAYLEEGIALQHISRDKRRHKPGETLLGPILAPPMPIRLREGDTLQLTRAPVAGEPAEIDEGDKTVIPAHISCAPPSIFDYLKPKQRVLIDDGHIGAVVESLNEIGAMLKITRAKPQGSKLAPEKGLNFPDTKMEMPALTDKDRRDLDFIVRHADIVGYSFVQSAADMQLLIDALAERDAKKLGIVAKIETRQALQNLPEIIVRGAGSHPFGVMIARGDLAVEVGYEQLAETQEEIMWLCESAHVPVIWATQVLEGLVKQNLPSRAEVTDAAMAERAECVMLNKGPFVLDAIDVLDHVVARMQSHQQKKSSRMRSLHW